MHETDLYQVFALLLLAAAVLAWLAQQLRQPPILAFIVTGIFAGPVGFGLVEANEHIAVLAEMGITILLFVVGLKLDLRQVRSLGPVTLTAGLGQILLTALLGWLLTLAFGLGLVEALYLAIAVAFSSTIIIVKLLSDQRELDSLHGRIALGILIVQDLAAVAAMMTVGAFQNHSADSTWLVAGVSALARMALVLAAVALLMRYVLPRLMHTVARSQELLLIFAIAWGTLLAAVGEAAGFGKEAGALLAGFALASSDYRESISTRLASVRDFLLLFFFIQLGAQLQLANLGGALSVAVVLALFVLVVKPLIVMLIMGYLGYRKRTGFMTGIALGQISEFSIIVVAMGIAAGHVDAGILGLTTLVALVTIALSTTMILFSQTLYTWLESWFPLPERGRPFREMRYERIRHAEDQPEVIVYGAGRYGSRLLKQLKERGRRVLGVDFDPENVRRVRGRGLPIRFGDAEDPDFPQHLPLGQTAWVVSTLPQVDLNTALIHALRRHGYTGSIAVVAHADDDVRSLHQAGADRVLMPFSDAADHAAETLDASCAALEACVGRAEAASKASVTPG